MASIPIVDGLDVVRGAPVPRRRRARERVEGGGAPRARAAVGDGQAAEAGTPARRPAARSQGRPARPPRRPACAWPRRAPTSWRPPWPSSTGRGVLDEQARLTIATTRHVADHFLPGWVARPTSQDVRIELIEGDTLASPRPCARARRRLGSPKARRPRSGCGRRSSARGDRRGRRAAPPVVRTAGVASRCGPRGADAGAAAAWPGIARRRRGRARPYGLGEAGTGRGGGSAAARGRGPQRGRRGVPAALPGRADVARASWRSVPVRDLAIEQPVRVVWRGARPCGSPARRLVEHLRRMS